MPNKNIIVGSVLIILVITFLVSKKINNTESTFKETTNSRTQSEGIASTSHPENSQQENQQPGITTQPTLIAYTQEVQEDKEPYWKGLKGTALRSRVYALEEPLLSTEVLEAGQFLSLQLFDDVEIAAEVTSSTRNINGTISTIAHVRGSQWGRVFIAQTNGEVRAKITVPEQNTMYGIHFNPADGNHYALELDISLEQTDDVGPHRIAPSAQTNSENLLSLLADQDVEESVPVALGDETVAATVVDIMVVYSNDAYAAAGSSSANMNNVIALGLLMANDAHANTNTGIVLNLVYSAQVAYADSGDQGTDLDNLTFTSPPYADMNIVQTWRETYGADFVSLMTGTGGGLAWKLTSSSGAPDYAFSVIGYPSFDGYAPVHEIGHNMGLSHAYDQDYQWGPTGGTIGNDAAGWHWHPTPGEKGYCSIMTYTNGSYFDGVPADNPDAATDGLDHVRVGLFSDPNISDHGEPVGHITYANNARVLRDLKNMYAGYRARNIAASSILIDYPNGSEQLQAGEKISIMWDSNGISGNVKIDLYRENTYHHTISADTLNDRIYEWTVPAILSGNTFKIRISAVADGSKYDESDNFFSIAETVYNETMDTSPGYTITGTNGWEYGPWRNATDMANGPTSSYTGTNFYDTNLDGASFLTTTLTTTAINCSNYQQVHLDFAGWFSMYSGYRAKIEVSNDNTTWHEIYSRDGTFYATVWTEYDFDISTYADGESTVYIRWVHENIGGGSNYAGMSVDDIKISGTLLPGIDKPPDFLTIPTNMLVKTSDPAQTSVIVNWDEPTVLDNEDGELVPIQKEGPASGSEFPFGTTTIVYGVTDSKGNSSTASFTVTVVPGTKFPWTMFLPAILANSQP